MTSEGRYSLPPVATPNPVTPLYDYTEASYPSTQFSGTPFEVAIANFYYRAGYDVANIRLMPNINDYPWFAIVSKQNEDGEYTSFRIGVVAKDLPGGEGIIERHKKVAEWVEGGNSGELWLTSVVPKESDEVRTKYTADIWQLRPSTESVRWKKKRTETFYVNR